MVAFLTFIFYFFLALFLLGLVGRIALRLWLKRLYRKMNPDFKEQSGDGIEWDRKYRKKSQSSKKMIEKNEGEYIDYEELG